MTVTIQVLTTAAEVSYNLAEDEGWIWGKKGSAWERPWWFGSWMMMPFAAGQLLHAFVFDRDTFPAVWHAIINDIDLIKLTFLGIWQLYFEEFAAVCSNETGGLPGAPSMA
jgi:hypothetical protein